MIPLMKTTFLNEQETKKNLANFILQSSKLSMGEYCQNFEEKFSDFQKRKYSVLFNSGGSANLAMIQSVLNLGRLKVGDKVGFSALTWSTNVMPLIQLGLIPVAIDCDLSRINVTSLQLKDTIQREDIKGFFSTNVLGFSGDLLEIKNICKESNVIFIEDNCESLGSKVDGNLTGNFGLGASFSFFVAHHMSTIEGGMVSTDDEEFNEMLKIVRANGWDRNLSINQQNKLREKHQITSEFQSKYSFYDLGYNLRPTEITGFLGLEQLKYLEDNITIREKNFMKVQTSISQNPDLRNLDINCMEYISSFAMPFIFNNNNFKESYMNNFLSSKVEIRPMISGNTQTQPFYKKYVSNIQNLPNTQFLHDNAFYCGNYPELTAADLDVISNCITK
tara:strand:+ start:34 stop:1206 length:1173 start_codon:yes stop_codon:yes gene_type:complete